MEEEIAKLEERIQELEDDLKTLQNLYEDMKQEKKNTEALVRAAYESF